MERLNYREALRRSGIMAVLAEFDPHIAGTPPLGLDLPTSDLDILCCAADPEAFTAAIWTSFSVEADFSIKQWIAADRPVIASFNAHGWKFQVFGQAKPVSEQNGWRHLLVERRFLDLGGPALRDALIRERAAGMKTEPAFAKVLRLEGDPYRALLDLEQEGDEVLLKLLAETGFGSTAEGRGRR